MMDGSQPIRYVRQHCSICDRPIEAWHEFPDNGIVFCHICFWKRPTDVCFHCGTVCNHKMIEIDEDNVSVSGEQESVLPDELFEEDE